MELPMCVLSLFDSRAARQEHMLGAREEIDSRCVGRWHVGKRNLIARIEVARIHGFRRLREAVIEAAARVGSGVWNQAVEDFPLLLVLYPPVYRSTQIPWFL